MTTINEVIAGLKVFAKYSGDMDGNISVEHDIIYAGIDINISDEDEAVLQAAGWHWDKGVGSWARFV